MGKRKGVKEDKELRGLDDGTRFHDNVEKELEAKSAGNLEKK